MLLDFLIQLLAESTEGKVGEIGLRLERFVCRVMVAEFGSGGSVLEKRGLDRVLCLQHPHHLLLMVLSLCLVELVLEIMSFFSVLLLLVVDHEVIVNSSQWFVICENLKHSFTNSWINLLAVATLTNWLVLIQRILNVYELCVRDVFHMKPL